MDAWSWSASPSPRTCTGAATTIELATQAPSLDLAADLRALLSYHFMVNALEAGALVATAAGAVGWFMVMRQQAFAGHALSVIAFPGAAGALLVGLPPLAGYLAFCAAGALTLAAVPGPGSHGRSGASARTGALQALALGVGFWFVNLYGGILGDVDSLLFGTFLGVDDAQLLTLAALTAVGLSVLALAGRPLLFATVDPQAARAVGVPVGVLSVGFLLLLGLTVAATSQITGALLVLTLLVTPAATAQLVTTRPAPSLALTVALALTVTWLGLAIAYFSPYPVGFWVTSLSFSVYVLAHAGRALRGWRG